MEKQVDKNHYSFARYVHLARWNSFYFQIKETLDLGIKTVLEIGAGNSVYKPVLEQEGVSYQCIDIAEDLHPDIVGSVDDMPIKDESYDCVVAFQVLEHLPYDMFDGALKEMARVSKKHVLISLPHFAPSIRFLLKVPFIREIKYILKIPFPKEQEPHNQHYWEVGKRGYSPKRIRRDMEKYFVVKKEYPLFENAYHRFYVLEKK